MRTLISQIRPAAILLLLLTLLTGLFYPASVTLAAQALFPHQANGSLIVRTGAIIGSELIGQAFDQPDYFWGRPSATSPFPYNAASSAGSNLGPSNPALAQIVQERIAALKAADPQNSSPIPIDLVTASASGLDPNISLEAALYQVGRVAKARGMSEEQVRALVAQYTSSPQLGFLGQQRVNVLLLNLALDEIQ